jgi:hypothetical protein
MAGVSEIRRIVSIQLSSYCVSQSVLFAVDFVNIATFHRLSDLVLCSRMADVSKIIRIATIQRSSYCISQSLLSDVDFVDIATLDSLSDLVVFANGGRH